MPVRLLIVDDADVFRRAAREVLVQRGYEVVGEATTGRAALEAARRLAPDGVLLDVRLPDASGLDVASELTRAHPGIVVLLASVSGDPSEPDDEAVRRSGARGFVPKWHLASTDLHRFWPLV